VNVYPPTPTALTMTQMSSPAIEPKSLGSGEDGQVRETFENVLGEMLFGQMLKAMRKTVGKPAYFHGGRAEEVFSQQLDRVLAEKISHASADKFVGPMYELWTVQGRR